jgi:acetate CoA/acetoacetate CoA-transferase beta subunit
VRPVSLIVTDLAVIEPSPEGLILLERAPGVDMDAIVAATGTALIVPVYVPEMAILPA